MKPGGGAAKGAEFERKVCTLLSLWLTSGKRPDILERNVQSGGRFTLATAKGRAVRGMPGDVMAAHPLAFDFLSAFQVECKHLASLGLVEFLYDTKNKSPLARIIALADKQSVQAEVPLNFMVIARENRREVAMFVKPLVFTAMQESTRFGVPLHHHAFHRNSIVMLHFEDVLAKVVPEAFLHVMRIRSAH